MIFILPILTAHTVMDWCAPPLSGLLEDMVAALHALPGAHEAWFLTDSSSTEALVRKAGATSVLRMGSVGDAPTRERLADTLEDHFGKATPVVVLDHRNPLLTVPVLMRAVDRFLEDSRLPLVSTVIPADHPVQLRTLYNVADVGMIHLFEAASAAPESLPAPCRRAQAVTKVFPFDWRIVENGNVGNVVYLPGKLGLVPYMPEETASWNALWIKEGPTTARIALGMHVPPGVCGYVSSSVDGDGGLSISQDGGALLLHTAGGGNAMVQLVPFTREGLSSRDPMLISFRGAKTRLSGFDGQVAGFAYVVQRSASGGQYAHESFFSPENGVWCARTQTAKDGCKLSGRQRFPSIFQVDPSLFLGTVEQMRRISDLLAAGEVRGFELGDHACLIQKPFDILRYKARLRCMNAGGGHGV